MEEVEFYTFLFDTSYSSPFGSLANLERIGIADEHHGQFEDLC